MPCFIIISLSHIFFISLFVTFLVSESVSVDSNIASSFIEQVFYTPSVVFTTGLLEVIVLVLLMDIESAIFEELVVLHHKMYDKLTVIDVILKETPKIIGIEYYSRRYSLYKKEFALRVVDTLIDIFGKTHIPSTIILITWPGSYLQEYLVGNIYMYFTEEIESMSKPMVIHVLNVTRGVSSTTRPIEVMKGVLRYDISFDPVHTAYFIEKVRSEVGGGSIAIIIEDVVGLLMAYGIERVYEVIYSIVRKLTSRDYVIILIPKDIIGSRELYALRNLTSGLLYL